MGLFCVYKHTAPNGKVYIGITSQKPIYRWNSGEAYGFLWRYEKRGTENVTV